MYMALMLLFELLTAALVLSGGPLLSQNMNHTLYPGENHKLGSFFHRVPLIDKMCNIGFQPLSPSFSCIHSSHVNAHRLDICDTMVYQYNSMGLGLPIANSS